MSAKIRKIGKAKSATKAKWSEKKIARLMQIANDETDTEDEQVDEVTSTHHTEASGQEVDMRAAGSSNNATMGFRGPLTGNSMNNRQFAEAMKEQMKINSRYVKFFDMVWQWTSNQGEYPRNSSYTYAEADVNGFSMGSWNCGYGIQRPIYSRENCSIAMDIYSQPINIFISDLIDTKLLNQWAKVYDKFRVIDFSIKVVLDTWNTHSHHLRPVGWNGCNMVDGGELSEYPITNNNWGQIDNGSANKNFIDVFGGTDRPVSKVPLHYAVYRDAYHDFVYLDPQEDWQNFSIPFLAGQGGNEGARRANQICNMNNFLTNLAPNEHYEFTKKVAAKANYFIQGDWLQVEANRNKNVSILINALEGISAEEADYAKPLYEGYNLLIAPINMPFVMHPTVFNDEEGKYYPEALCTTKGYIKITATWEAWDFKYENDLPVGRMVNNQLSEFGRQAHRFKVTNLKQFGPKVAQPKEVTIKELAGSFDANVQ